MHLKTTNIELRGGGYEDYTLHISYDDETFKTIVINKTRKHDADNLECVKAYALGMAVGLEYITLDDAQNEFFLDNL